MSGKLVMGGWSRSSQWCGRSGRRYDMVAESLANFSMQGDSLYLLAKGGATLWVGSSGDLVEDPLSRVRFRLALTCSDRVFRIDGHAAQAGRLATIWDLEGGAPEAIAA